MNPGAAFGSYTVIGPLGRGAMGEVYRARDTRLGREVAVKILPEAFASDADRLRRFIREAQALAALNHPNIATIYGVEQVGAAPALVMELVEGQTVADLLGTRAISLVEAVSLLRQIAAALEAAHEQGIIHRDLKPANIKVRPDGTVKVLDFGLAKISSPHAGVDDLATVSETGTTAGVILGTAAYMSPEQARGQEVDRRTDIWAYGCIGLEMLLGRRAFAGDSVPDLLAAILQQEPDWSGLPAETPVWLRDLLRRCLHKDPRRRLRDAGDARLEIEERQDRPELVEKTEATRRPRGWVVPAWAAFAMVVVAAAIPPGMGRFFGGSADDTPRFDRIIRFVATPAHESAAAISPDGKWVTYLSNARGPTDVWVKFVAGGDAVNLTAASGLEVGSQDYIGGLDVSPDGTLISFAAGVPGALQNQMATWVIPAPLGGVPRRLLGSSEQGMRWSPDGARVCYVRAGGPAGDALWIADADGANAREVVQMEGGKHLHWPRWSRDARFIYFNYGFHNVNNGPMEIYRVGTEGGAVEPVVRTARLAVFPFPSADGTGVFFSSNRDGVELALWWHDLSSRRERRLTNGIGDYSEPHESADGRRLVGTFNNVRQLIVRVPVTGSSPIPRALTDGTTGDLDPAGSADGSRIVFSSSRSGNRNLWSARADLTDAAPLTVGNAIDERPAFSPDGRRIAFVSDRGGRRGIWVMEADGGQPRLVVVDYVLDTISWSPDGQKIVYAVGGGSAPSLRLVSVADGRVTRLSTPAGAVAPAWSPVADLIAYLEPSRGRGAFLRLIDSQGRSQRSPMSDVTENFSNGYLAWSPDGERLAAVTLPGNRNGTLWVIEARQGIPIRRLLNLPTEEFVRGVTWAGDGKAILVGTIATSGDVYLAERSAK